MVSHVMNTYGRLPVAFTHGEGAGIYDESGRRYLDALAGIAVSTLGHAHPRLVTALAEQAGRLLHTSNLYRIPEQERLAERLCALSGMEEAFFCNSGCEANEAAIKLARLYGHERGIEAPAIVVMERAFHGRTLATLSATGNRKVQAGFEPLVTGFVRVPFGELAALRQSLEYNRNIVAVMIEIVQGEGGIYLASPDYQRAVRELCDRHELLLITDEVQCGVGRTGRWFGFQHAGVLPDVMTLAKGLGSGVPIGACLAAGRAQGVFKPGSHGSTFGGNPLACVAALTTLAVIESDALLANATRVGTRIRDGLAQGLSGVAGVREVRGLGLMVGVELERACKDLVAQALDAGLLINVTADNVVRLLPPLIFSEADADQLLSVLVPLIRDFLAKAA
ncbi:MAG: Acetylornithine aminotransferase [Rhodocyclaceae bacterium]|nr:Acetylornithine aminotransferase [Rhodocyclaceae bacterium]